MADEAKGVVVMNKEEILKMAQTENRGRDVADLDAQRKGAYFAYIIGICLIIAVDIVEGIVLHRISFGCNVAMFVMAYKVPYPRKEA